MQKPKLTKVSLVIDTGLMCVVRQAWGQVPTNTGNDLMAGCRAAESMMGDNIVPNAPDLMFTAGLCIGHLNTALFFMQMLTPDHPGKDDLICIPSNVTVTQFLGVLNKYMREHPERRNEVFNNVIGDAAGNAWPCNNAK